ncbi:Gti1/Pac2 family-domain-containing protein [Mycena galopus ATCC 62051]|nr:Gti1/Pac2 family-domain-containing protein [Mycena galopus ATCC 62051]
MPIQRPTCEGIRVRSPQDAHVIFHGVFTRRLPMITRRLDTEERRAITSGCVFVWEERGGPNTEPMGLGIERWTDSIRWGPSRVREEFLFYHEKDDPVEIDLTYDSDVPSPLGYGPTHVLMRENLIKQTYSVFVETPHGRRKWHLRHRRLPSDRRGHPLPRRASRPVGMYKSARSAKGPGRTRTTDQSYLHGSSTVNRSQPSYLVLAPDFVCDPNMTSRRMHEILAPLEYLENMPPPRRHPVDEKALMSFVPTLS